MIYPSQPGYPTPQHGQPKLPGGRRENNLWLIGGTLLIVLIIVFTTILLVVQRTVESNAADGGGGDTGGSTEEPTGGGDDGGDTGGDTGGDSGDTGGEDGGSPGGDVSAVTLGADACNAFDLGPFEELFSNYDPDQTYVSGSNTSVSCTFYTEDYESLGIRIYDYEDASYVVSFIESDEDYYGEEDGYDFRQYDEYGDAGSFYSKDYSGYGTTTLHVALGSLEVSVSVSWFDDPLGEDVTLPLLEEYLFQCDEMFAEYQ